MGLDTSYNNISECIKTHAHSWTQTHKHVYTQTNNTLFNLAGTKRNIITGCPIFDSSSVLNIAAALLGVRHWNVAAWININDVTDFTHQTPDIVVV